MKKDFQPLINNSNFKKTTLKDKKVSIQGNSDFGRIETPTVNQSKESSNKTNKSHNDPRMKATMTQKISPLVNLKINTLKPFLGELENMPKATVNEIIDLLVDSYVGVRLTTRQQEAFKSMLDLQTELLKK